MGTIAAPDKTIGALVYEPHELMGEVTMIIERRAR